MKQLKYLAKLCTFIFLLFVATILFTGRADAAAPADLQVGMALQRYGVSGTVPFNYGAKVDVVSKTTTNGIAIPIATSPYNGNHLDTDNNSSPNANTLTFGVGPTVNNNILGGGTYYSTTYNNLIWCGNSVGVPDKQFLLDVSVGFATSDSQTINVGGVNITGKWTGFWNFEAGGTLGEKNFFNGKSVRVPALNPYKTFVFFVFVEDPPAPPPTYSGTISTNKRLATTSAILSTGSTPGNALIELKSPYTAQPIFDSNSTSNPWNRSNVYVTWNNQTLNTPGRYYKNAITVPVGWRVNRVQVSLPNNVLLANDGLSCTDGQSGVCTVSGLTVFSGSVTYVDWFLEKIPVPIPYYPWLQTKNGDVTSGDILANSTGKITGQEIGPADLNTTRGARRAGVSTAESSFVVAASDTEGKYFCSQERFVLGKSLEDRDNLDGLSCKTGGYTPSPVDFNKVKASVAKAYADNGNGAAVAATNKCNPKYATTAVAVGTPPNLGIDLGCPAGGIQKIGGQGDTVTLSSLLPALIVNGRGTLWIPGKLVINNDIKYSTTNSTNDPKTTPNLVIFVEGDVEIAPNVLQIDASIISKGTISTCNQSTVSTRACENKLVINGFLASDNKKINFARRYYAEPYTTATPSPAELINLTSQSTTFPAPGLDRTDTDVTSKLQINSGELAPRLR
jgi:hypothetical protein